MDDGEVGVARGNDGEHACPPVGFRRPQTGMAGDDLPDSWQIELVNNGSGFHAHPKIMASMIGAR
jgi:hypothetical protein